MDLNKDSQDIYTIDTESYSEYMQENRTEPRDLLRSFIKLLLLILLLVISYFFYKVVKADLSFSEVFNKNELISTYELLNSNNKLEYVKEEDYVEVLAKNISSHIEVDKKYDEPSPETIVKVEIEKVTAVVVSEVILEEPPSLVDDEVKTTELREEIAEEIKVEPVELAIEEVISNIVEVKTVESVIFKEETTPTVLSKTYLDRMVKELNSL